MEKELENKIDLVEQESTETVVAVEEKSPVKTKKTEKVESVETPVKSNRRVMTGKVKSNKMDKTIVVSIERQVIHPLYKKYYKRTKRVMAHDENNSCNIGDTVKVRESRPMSARKRWELVDIIDRAK